MCAPIILPTQDRTESAGDPALRAAFDGRASRGLADLSQDDLRPERDIFPRLLKIVVPIRLGGDEAVGAYEVYLHLAVVEPPIRAMQHFLWVRLAIALGVLYLALFGLVRRASQQLRNAARAEQQALRRSEERFRSLVRNASDVIAILDADGTLRYRSPAAERAWGNAPESLTGRSALALVHPDDRAAARDLLDQARGSPGGTNITTELRLRHADGSWRDFEVIANNLLADAGVAGILVTYRDITERKAFEQELARLAFHDSLSNLPNRALFLDRLAHALARADRSGRAVAVMFLDLDNFKVINDSLGHDTGDRLLVVVAERLRACLRATDTAARLGGDEFTVLLEDVTDPGEVTAVADRVAEALRAPVDLGGHEVVPSASIGIAVSAAGRDGPDGLLRNADLAMYRAKANGKARYEVFDQSMNASAVERLELEAELRHAIERDEFWLAYQPIVALDTGTMIEVEALLRWQRPGRGLVAPAQFIPVAEETGLIVPIGRWVIEQACRQARVWQTRYPSDPTLVMSVNLSVRQFQHPSLVQDVARILRDTGLEPSSLKLEITESVLMGDVESTIATLRELKGLGVGLAIDDFGTGYSSLNYLKRFPVDTLKIDRSFVDGLGHDPRDTAIVRGVIALAKSLSLAVTGEGIETSEQLGQLEALGCDRGQGYYFARPLPSDALDEVLAASRPQRAA